VPVELEVDEGVATVTINRPERLNAMDGETYQGGGGNRGGNPIV